jgi:hypothetical protein
MGSVTGSSRRFVVGIRFIGPTSNRKTKMKNTKEKLIKRFDRLSAQYTKCRDLYKMRQMFTEMENIVEQLKKFEA